VQAVNVKAQADLKSAQQNVDEEDSKVDEANKQLAAVLAEKDMALSQATESQTNVIAAKLNLSYTKLFAPCDGRVTRKAVETGDYLQVAQQVMSIVPDEVWVTANFKESQLDKMRTNQPVWVEIDALGGRKFRAHVDSIQAGSGAAFSLLPPENATGNFVKVIQRVLWWIIRIAPLGTLGLIANAVIKYGTDKLASLIWFAVAVYIGLALVLFVVYPILVKVHGLSIKQYYSGVWPAVQLGFVSRSSIGTLPVTERVVERNLGVPSAYASFAVPFGATTKMDGCAAIYPALAAIFVAQFFGIALSPIQYLLIIVVAVFGSAATAGTTGATVMLTLTLSTLGLPLEGVGLLLAIDPILDMGRTATNVAGQALVPTLVAKREGILDLGLYNAPRQGLPFADEGDEDAPLEQAAPARAVV